MKLSYSDFMTLVFEKKSVPFAVLNVSSKAEFHVKDGAETALKNKDFLCSGIASFASKRFKFTLDRTVDEKVKKKLVICMHKAQAAEKPLNSQWDDMWDEKSVKLKTEEDANPQAPQPAAPPPAAQIPPPQQPGDPNALPLKGYADLTKLQLHKIDVLNPNGPVDGKVRMPRALSNQQVMEVIARKGWPKNTRAMAFDASAITLQTRPPFPAVAGPEPGAAALSPLEVHQLAVLNPDGFLTGTVLVPQSLTNDQTHAFLLQQGADIATTAVKRVAVENITLETPAPPTRPKSRDLGKTHAADLKRLKEEFEQAKQHFPFARAKLELLHANVEEQIGKPAGEAAVLEFQKFVQHDVKVLFLTRKIQLIPERLSQALRKAQNDAEKDSLKALFNQIKAQKETNPQAAIELYAKLEGQFNRLLARPIDEVKAQWATFQAELSQLAKLAPGADLPGYYQKLKAALSDSDAATATQLLEQVVNLIAKIKANAAPDAVQDRIGKSLFLAKDNSGRTILPKVAMKDPDLIDKFAADSLQGYDQTLVLFQQFADELDKKTKELIPKKFDVKFSNCVNVLLPEETRPKLSIDEANALKFYTSTSSQDGAEFNSPLRKGEPLQGDRKEQYKHLKDAFKKAKPFKVPLDVIRGNAFRNEDKTQNVAATEEFMKRFKEGAVTQLKGFMSTATAGKPGNFQGDIVLYIKACKGLDTLPYTDIPQEKELLLDEPTDLLVTKITKRGTQYDVYCEQKL